MKIKAQVICCFLLFGLMSPVFAGEFDKRYYLGLGLGLSNLEPKTKDTGFKVDDKQDTAGKIYLGMDITKRLGAELYFADLGAAALKSSTSNTKGDIDYKIFGLSALYHFYNNHGNEGLMNRSGWDWFAKAGIGSLDNTSDLPFKKNKGTHLMLALGTEYEWRNGFAVRVEAETFDEDIQLITLGVLQRFGKTRGSSKKTVDSESAKTVAEVSTEAEPVIEVVPAPVIIESAASYDGDNDGVTDKMDKCLETEPGTEVNNEGCDAFNSVLEGVQFKTASAELTTQSRTVLDQLALQLVTNPEVRVAVMAHTDNSGPAAANLELSKQRAIAVVRYLISKGVKGKRMQPEAYGESRPRKSNDTVKGRDSNRRVGFRRLN